MYHPQSEQMKQTAWEQIEAFEMCGKGSNDHINIAYNYFYL